VLFGGSVGQLKEAASRAVLMIILRKTGLSIRANAVSNSTVSRVLAKQLRRSLRGGILSSRFRR